MELIGHMHPVDQVLSPAKLLALGIQHVLVMYAGAGGGAAHHRRSARIFRKIRSRTLLARDLLCCGIASLHPVDRPRPLRHSVARHHGRLFRRCRTHGQHGEKSGTRSDGDLRRDVDGRPDQHPVRASGRAAVALFPADRGRDRDHRDRARRVQVGINWAAGGVGNPEYGNPVFLGTSFAVLVFILVITRFVRGFIANISVLLGIVFGFVIALLLGRVSFQGLGDAAWLDIVVPFHFGWPTFDPLSILTLTIVQVVIFIEFDRDVPGPRRDGREAGRRKGSRARPACRRTGDADRRRPELLPAQLLLAKRRAHRRHRVYAAAG